MLPQFNNPNDPSQYDPSSSARRLIKTEFEKQKSYLEQRLFELEGLIGLAESGEQVANDPNNREKGYGDVQISAGEVKRMAQPVPQVSLPYIGPPGPMVLLPALGGRPPRLGLLGARPAGLSGLGSFGIPDGAMGDYLVSQRVILALMARVGVLNAMSRGVRTSIGFGAGVPPDMDRETLMRLKELLGPSGNPYQPGNG